MVRPLSAVTKGRIDEGWRYLIIDGYVDEPSALGVPPFISPHVRSLAGGLVKGGANPAEIGYLTIDQVRGLRGAIQWKAWPELESCVIVKGCIVPGKYLRGTPISPREVMEIVSSLKGPRTYVWEPENASGSPPWERVKGDPGVLGLSLAISGSPRMRERTHDEWNDNLVEGAFIIMLHPDHPSPLIAEIETSRGCTRYLTGGCSFCIEPSRGPIQYRTPEEIVSEVRALAGNALENVRIGGQSDLVSYMSTDSHREEAPCPDPASLEEMMSGVRTALHSGSGVRSAETSGRRIGLETGIIHTDNANPAVIARHPERSRKTLDAIGRNCTSGSVLAFGIESADPEVGAANNLNSTAQEVLEAVRVMNEVGSVKGENGMPALLPGLNFLGGLKGQTSESFRHDLELLERIDSEGLMLRRINIRSVMLHHTQGDRRGHAGDASFDREFRRFKREVRERFDTSFSQRMLPFGSTLRGVFVEASQGHYRFGRQIGSYPILVRLDHPWDLGVFTDVCVTSTSSRSVSGFRSPFPLNTAPFSHLSAIPGIGRKRAATLFRHRPVTGDELSGKMGLDPRIIDHLDID